MHRRLNKYCAAALLLAALGGAAEAQDAAQAGPQREAAPAAEASPDEAKVDLGEVVVTATRREKSISKVPAAVSEVGGQTLEAVAIRDTQSLLMEVPSLNVSISGSENAGGVIRIRGIGTTSSNAGFESSVGVFVDGVYQPRSGLALNDLVDVERIEVLRGPQGTLFGKNTAVGAINILTRKPGLKPEAELGAAVGNFGAYLARMVLSGPVWDDKLALRLSGQYNRRDGYIDNLTDGEDYNNRDRYVLRGQALFEPMSDLSIRLIADYSRKDERCCAAPYTINGASATKIEALGGTVFEPPAETTAAFDYPTRSTLRQHGVSTHLDWDLGDGMQLRGLLSYQDGEGDDPADGDYSDLDIAYIPYARSQITEKTAELSLHGKYRWLDWLGGFYYSNEDIDVSSSTLLGEDAGTFLLYGTPALPQAGVLYPPDTGQTSTVANQSGDSWSLFTHNVADLGAGFDLTLGLRYLMESKDGGGQTISNSPSCAIPAAAILCAAPAYQADYDDDRFVGTGALGKRFGRSYLYGSYSSGFKAGGINLNPPSTTNPDTSKTFKPETVDAYELGFKLPLLDGRLQTRTALFWMDFDDFQINTYDGRNFTPSNVPSVRSKGVEFESTFIVMYGLSLRGGFTFTDAKYGDVSDEALDGKQLTNAPRWVGQLGTSYQHGLPWGGAAGFANLSMRYQSKVNTGSDLDRNKRQDEYALLNARAGLRFPGELEVSLWGANLTDEHYYLVIFNSVAQTGSYNGYVGVPRTYGIEISKRFGL